MFSKKKNLKSRKDTHYYDPFEVKQTTNVLFKRCLGFLPRYLQDRRIKFVNQWLWDPIKASKPNSYYTTERTNIDLPNDVWTVIFSFCNLLDIGSNLLLVNKTMNKIIHEWNPEIAYLSTLLSNTSVETIQDVACTIQALSLEQEIHSSTDIPSLKNPAWSAIFQQWVQQKQIRILRTDEAIGMQSYGFTCYFTIESLPELLFFCYTNIGYDERARCSDVLVQLRYYKKITQQHSPVEEEESKEKDVGEQTESRELLHFFTYRGEDDSLINTPHASWNAIGFRHPLESENDSKYLPLALGLLSIICPAANFINERVLDVLEISLYSPEPATVYPENPIQLIESKALMKQHFEKFTPQQRQTIYGRLIYWKNVVINQSHSYSYQISSTFGEYCSEEYREILLKDFSRGNGCYIYIYATNWNSYSGSCISNQQLLARISDFGRQWEIFYKEQENESWEADRENNTKKMKMSEDSPLENDDYRCYAFLETPCCRTFSETIPEIIWNDPKKQERDEQDSF